MIEGLIVAWATQQDPFSNHRLGRSSMVEALPSLNEVLCSSPEFQTNIQECLIGTWRKLPGCLKLNNYFPSSYSVVSNMAELGKVECCQRLKTLIRVWLMFVVGGGSDGEGFVFQKKQLLYQA